MFTYKGCKGEKELSPAGGFVWMITFEDGTHDMAFTLDTAIALCDKEVRRASI